MIRIGEGQQGGAILESWWLYKKRDQRGPMSALSVSCQVMPCMALGLCQQEGH